MKSNEQEVFLLQNDFSRMGPDDDDLCDAWLERFDGYRKMRFTKPNPVNWPDQVIFWANWTFDQTDYLNCDTSWPLFSPKLLNVFEECNVPLRKYPVTLLRGASQKEATEYRGYHTVQLLCHHDIMNYEESEYRMSDLVPDTIERIEKLVLKKPQQGFPFVFRLSKEPTHIFVNREMKLKLESEGIKGIKFDTLDEVFSGSLSDDELEKMGLLD